MCTVESAWCDVPRMAVLLLPGMLHVPPPGTFGLIILDTTSFHTDNQVIGMLNSIRYKVAVLLGGITGELQPNVRINKQSTCFNPNSVITHYFGRKYCNTIKFRSLVTTLLES